MSETTAAAAGMERPRQDRRTPDGRWAKGTSGRPPGILDKRSRFTKEALEVAARHVPSVLEAALTARSVRLRFDAAAWLCEMLLGRPRQSLDVAGISGLATRLLAREDASTLLLLGTGNLAPYMIRANASVRPLKKVMIWGRTAAKVDALVAAMAIEFPEIHFSAITDREAACAEADIVVAATGSAEPVVLGDWIKPGTHTDFIGNHHATKRECDTALITKAKVYADSRVNAFKEAGEILVPISEGVFTREDVVAELTEMCAGTAPLRQSADEITLFKSIGMAMSDLVGAGLAYKTVTGA